MTVGEPYLGQEEVLVSRSLESGCSQRKVVTIDEMNATLLQEKDCKEHVGAYLFDREDVAA